MVTIAGANRLDFTGNIRLQQEVDVFGSARLRFGWVSDNLLFFATGGLGWARVKTRFELHNVQIQATDALGDIKRAVFIRGLSPNLTHVRFGYSLGGGFEWKFNSSWSIKTDYLFFDLDDGRILTMTGGTAQANIYMHVMRVGLNLHF